MRGMEGPALFFRYDSARGLPTIGCNVGEQGRDPSCHDLPTSEARLASFLRIAQGQIPPRRRQARQRTAGVCDLDGVVIIAAGVDAGRVQGLIPR